MTVFDPMKPAKYPQLGARTLPSQPTTGNSPIALEAALNALSEEMTQEAIDRKARQDRAKAAAEAQAKLAKP